MALQKTISLPNGLSCEYIRIKMGIITNGLTSAMVVVELWKDLATRNEAGLTPIQETGYNIELVGQGTCLEQAYLGLKNLPEFSDAQDV